MQIGTVRSEFKLPMTIGVIGFTILLLGILLFVIYVWVVDIKDIDLFQRILMAFFPLMVIPLIVRIELPKIKRLTIDHDGITIQSPFTVLSKRMNWDDLDGYHTMVHFTRHGILKELILVSNEKVIFELSENYIQNYQTVKRALTRNLNNLGTLDVSYFQFLNSRVLK